MVKERMKGIAIEHVNTTDREILCKFSWAAPPTKIKWTNFLKIILWSKYCPNDCPQQQLCGHCVQTYPIAIAVCIVLPQIASGGVVDGSLHY